MGKDRQNKNSRHNLKKKKIEEKYGGGLKNTNSVQPKEAKEQLKAHRKMQINSSKMKCDSWLNISILTN